MESLELCAHRDAQLIFDKKQRNWMGRTVSSGAGATELPSKANKQNHGPSSPPQQDPRSNSKWTLGPNVNHESITFFRENI